MISDTLHYYLEKLCLKKMMEKMKEKGISYISV